VWLKFGLSGNQPSDPEVCEYCQSSTVNDYTTLLALLKAGWVMEGGCDQIELSGCNLGSLSRVVVTIKGIAEQCFC